MPRTRQLRSRILIHHSDAEDVSYLATHTQADNQLRQDDQSYSASVEHSLNDYAQCSHQSTQNGDSLASSTMRERDRSAPRTERILENGIDGLNNRYAELVAAKIDADRAGGYSPGDTDPSHNGSITYTDAGHIQADLRIQLDGSPTHAWQQLFDKTGNRETLVTIMTDVARALADDSPEDTPWRRRSGTALVDAGVTALDGYLASTFAHAAEGIDHD